MSTSDAYAILGLPFGSPADELKKAYRTLVLRWHPNHNESCPKAMIMTQSLNEARETLLLSGLGERLHAALLRQREEAARKKQEEEAKVCSSYSKSYITRPPLVPLQPPPLQLLGAPRLGFAQ